MRRQTPTPAERQAMHLHQASGEKPDTCIKQAANSQTLALSKRWTSSPHSESMSQQLYPSCHKGQTGHWRTILAMSQQLYPSCHNMGQTGHWRTTQTGEARAPGAAHAPRMKGHGSTATSKGPLVTTGARTVRSFLKLRDGLRPPSPQSASCSAPMLVPGANSPHR
jgi:hypothetical protein